MLRHIALIVLAFLPFGCTTVTPISVKDMTIAPQSGKGIVLGSLTRSMDMVAGDSNSYQIRFRNQADQQEYVITHTRAAINVLFGDEIQEKDDWGTIIARDLPAGDYEVFEYHFTVKDYLGRSFIGRLQQKPVFHVKAGQITYVGEFKQTIFLQERNDDRRILKGTVLSVHDQHDRDIQLLTKKFPDLAGQKIEKNLAR